MVKCKQGMFVNLENTMTSTLDSRNLLYQVILTICTDVSMNVYEVHRRRHVYHNLQQIQKGCTASIYSVTTWFLSPMAFANLSHSFFPTLRSIFFSALSTDSFHLALEGFFGAPSTLDSLASPYLPPLTLASAPFGLLSVTLCPHLHPGSTSN